MKKINLVLLFTIVVCSVFANEEIDPFSSEMDYRVNLTVADYERQFDSIYNALVSEDFMREFQEYMNIKVEGTGEYGIDTLYNFIKGNSDNGDVSIGFKDIDGCIGELTSDYDAVWASQGVISSYSLTTALKLAYINCMSFMMDNIIRRTGNSYSFVKTLYDWKKEMYLTYTFLLKSSTELKICEKYAYRNGIYTVYMLFNFQREKINNVLNEEFKESDFDNLYISDEKFQGVCSYELHMWKNINREYGEILVAYEQVTVKCESCPSGWKLVKLKK